MSTDQQALEKQLELLDITKCLYCYYSGNECTATVSYSYTNGGVKEYDIFYTHCETEALIARDTFTDAGAVVTAMLKTEARAGFWDVSFQDL